MAMTPEQVLVRMQQIAVVPATPELVYEVKELVCVDAGIILSRSFIDWVNANRLQIKKTLQSAGYTVVDDSP